MFRTSLPLVLALLACTVCLPAVAQESLAGSESESIDLDGRAGWASIPGELREIARLETSADNSIVWSVDETNGELVVAITATYPNPPLLAAELAEKLDPVESFMAAAGPDVPVPDALLAAAPADAVLPDMSRERREALHQANRVALVAFDALTDDGRAPVKACSNSFKSWVGSVYGSSTCGNTTYNGNAWTYPYDTYCTSGCDYKLGEYDKGSCQPALASCDIVKGTAKNRRQRWADVHGSYTIGYTGHHAHYGAASCLGSNGSIAVERTRGGSVYNSTVPVNGMKHWYQGAWNVPVSAVNFVAYGNWTYGIPESGTYFKFNQLKVTNNSGTNDRAILCGDVKREYTMSGPPGSCHGPNVSLCYPGSCDSACFDCAGGSC